MQQLLYRAAAVLTISVLACAAADAQTTGASTQTPGATTAAPPTNLPAAAPPANPPENPLVTTRVRDAFLAWQSGRIDRKTYSPNAGGTYSDPVIAQVSPDLNAVGAPQTVTYRTASLLLGDLVYRYDIVGATGTVSVLYALDMNGRTDNIVFTPVIFRTVVPAQ